MFAGELAPSHFDWYKPCSVVTVAVKLIFCIAHTQMFNMAWIDVEFWFSIIYNGVSVV